MTIFLRIYHKKYSFNINHSILYRKQSCKTNSGNQICVHIVFRFLSAAFEKAKKKSLSDR